MRILGLAGYYKRFVKDFRKIVQPLTNYLKVGESFQWSKKVDEAFGRLKKALVIALGSFQCF